MEKNIGQPQRSGQKVEIARMWGTETETIPVIVGAALEAMPPRSIKGNLKKILKNFKPSRKSHYAGWLSFFGILYK